MGFILVDTSQVRAYCNKLRRHRTRFGKITTTAVLDKDENLLRSGLHILLLGKYYIYSQKCQKGIPSLQGFIAKTRRVYNIELYIARKRGTLNKHLSKWEKLINIM